MILRFTFENWMSFRDSVTFSMIASRERQHRDRVPSLEKYRTKALPIAVIYGGNASGKSNFFKAFQFVQSLVVNGAPYDGLINVEPFRLNNENAELPTRFQFELLIEETIYEFSFAVTQSTVLEERLVKVNSSSETVLYDRQGSEPNFALELKDDMALRYAYSGTRENLLFLTNSVLQKIDIFKPIYDWFRFNLVLISPNAQFNFRELFVDEDHPLNITMNENLQKLDTGISRLAGEEVPFDNLLLSDALKKHIKENLKEGDSGVLMSAPSNERYSITRKNSELVAMKLVTYHSKQNGEEIKFELNQESDGSQRVLDLLPGFLEQSSQRSKKVYIIDELDRSLHTLLCRQLVEMYLDNSSSHTRAQLLLTTHDLLLMDQNLFRRDEMWLTERDFTENSSLVSIGDYKDVRRDKDIRKSYLQGRFGGIPTIGPLNLIVAAHQKDQNNARE